MIESEKFQAMAAELRADPNSRLFLEAAEKLLRLMEKNGALVVVEREFASCFLTTWYLSGVTGREHLLDPDSLLLHMKVSERRSR